MSADTVLPTEIFQEKYIPLQTPAPQTPHDMTTILQSYPPLGQVTTTQREVVSITAVLDAPASRALESWQVALWLSIDDGTWTQVLLSPISTEEAPESLQGHSESRHLLFFTAHITIGSSAQFTLKFRCHGHAEWSWVRDEHGCDDGRVIKQTTDEPGDVWDLLPDLSKSWKVSNCASQAPRSNLWSLEAPVSQANENSSSFTDVDIGIPWGNFVRWFALVRLWSPWLAPRQGKTAFALDKDAVLCSFLGTHGRHLIFLAVSGVGDVTSVLRSTSRGLIGATIRNDAAMESKGIVLVSESDDFDCAVAAVMYHARSIIDKDKLGRQDIDEELETLTGEVEPQWRENWYDGLGYCTWNALGQNLTEQKIWDAVDKLAEEGINFTSLIIDDGWQSLDYRGHGQFQHGWVDFEANPKAFPNGLKSTVSHIRNQHPEIQHIAVWHAMLGYWGGLAHDGKIVQNYKTIEVVREDSERRNLPLGGKMTVVAKEDILRLYDDFYKFLSGAGIDAVKTDAQFMMDTWVDPSVRRDLIKTYLDAWTITSLRYFSIKSISCMSQFPQALFYSQMPQNRPTMLVRNSDDFFPEIAASHPWHVWANAHNSILAAYLNVLPDWDMFQTVHDYSGFHAAARCVSGGPIYITDVPGQHNRGLIRQMTGVTPRGKTVIFRPSVVGRSIAPYVGYHDDILLKVGGFHGSSETGTPILAVFNISSRPLTELIPLSWFPGAASGIEYVIRAHSTGRVSRPVSEGRLFAASLEVRGHEILTAFPLRVFEGRTESCVGVSNLGLLGKMTGSAALVSSMTEQLENGRIKVDTRIKALGILGLYISSLPDMTVEDNFMATIQDRPIPRNTVSISGQDKHVLEIDVDAAWKEMGLSSGWGNEVEVKVYFDS